MAYYYLHPFKPQYFFPKHFQEDPVFRSFFQPYTLKGKISWALFSNSSFYRVFFKKNNINQYIPESCIRSILKFQGSMAFNRGSVGPEQKITALGKENEKYFFIKYAQTPLAQKNVTNEYNILKQFETKVDFTPTACEIYKDDRQILLKTDVLKGDRVQKKDLNEAIMNILLLLPELDIKAKKVTCSNLKLALAHGDYCPWNMMDYNGKIRLFDWEMGGKYPLGYDLFTFIFQTNFLLSPKTSLKEIFASNKYYINYYFNHFGIQEWNTYLSEFSRIKTLVEREKGGNGLYDQYKKLTQYV